MMPTTTTARRLGTLAAAASLALIVGVPHASAAGIVVSTLADTDANDGQCSLREALDAASFDTASGAAAGECGAGSGADTITFAVGGTIVLGSDLPPIRDDLVIDGAGTVTVDGATSYRPFTIIDGAAVVLEELVITRGFSSTAGGNIYVHQFPTEVTLLRSEVRDGVAGFDGGGIWNNSGTLTVVDSSLTANAATAGSGGAIHNRVGGTLTVTGSTLEANTACAFGGGLWNTGEATVTNSTISGNVAGGCSGSAGGGVYSSGTLDLVHVTVANNTGIGVATDGNTATSISNSVLAANVPADCGDVGLSGGNVVSDASCADAGASDQVSTDPLLGALGANGGPTLTHALLPGSPAIDAAVGCPPPSVDQRGTPRNDGACDAGAFEAQGVAPSPSPTPLASPEASPAPSGSPGPTGSAVATAGPPATAAVTLPPTATDGAGGGASSPHVLVLLTCAIMLAVLRLSARRTRGARGR